MVFECILNKEVSTVKFKILILALICTSGISVLFGCSDSNSTISDSTTTTATKANIDFTAHFNKDNKTIQTTLTNNTGDKILYYNRLYKLYKKDDSEWTDVTFEYATYSMEYHLLPDSGINSVDLDYPAYNNAGENINFAEEKAKLEPGTYKITIDVNAFPESEAKTLPAYDDSTYPSDNPEGKYIDTSEADGENISVSAEFSVE